MTVICTPVFYLYMSTSFCSIWDNSVILHDTQVEEQMDQALVKLKAEKQSVVQCVQDTLHGLKTNHRKKRENVLTNALLGQEAKVRWWGLNIWEMARNVADSSVCMVPVILSQTLGENHLEVGGHSKVAQDRRCCGSEEMNSLESHTN